MRALRVYLFYVGGFTALFHAVKIEKFNFAIQKKHIFVELTPT
jgi:hypothetical protein